MTSSRIVIFQLGGRISAEAKVELERILDQEKPSYMELIYDDGLMRQTQAVTRLQNPVIGRGALMISKVNEPMNKFHEGLIKWSVNHDLFVDLDGKQPVLLSFRPGHTPENYERSADRSGTPMMYIETLIGLIEGAKIDGKEVEDLFAYHYLPPPLEPIDIED